jgi:hypothetical protein
MKREDQSDWAKLYREFSTSDEPLSTWCDKRHLLYGKAQYHFSRLRKQGSIKKPPAPSLSAPSGFIELAPRHLHHAGHFRLHLPNGIVLEVPAQFDAAALRLLISTVS